MTQTKYICGLSPKSSDQSTKTNQMNMPLVC